MNTGTGQIPQRAPDGITLFRCGDVMTGRGIGQVLAHPSDARRYVSLAEQISGSFDKAVDFAYVWGYALTELGRVRPVLCLINLETAITGSDRFWSGKDIHYHMRPRNLPCITAAAIDMAAGRAEQGGQGSWLLGGSRAGRQPKPALEIMSSDYWRQPQ